MTERDTSDWTPIVIRGPLPMDVAGTLMTLIGTAYPSAVIDGSGEHLRGWGSAERAFVLLIDPKERARTVSERAAAEAKVDAEDAPGDALGFTAENDAAILHTSAPEDLCRILGGYAHHIFEAMAGDNYIEWEVRHQPEGQAYYSRYVLSVARSKGQTPHALRTKAQGELDQLRAAVRELADDLEADCPGAPDKHRTCVGARVRALVGE